ncbi:MAG: hypothetical protein HYY16_01610 [Planctomycetes bacterium]|nr:hypothetical protein [Planctomycetota bacterium]
MGQEAIYCNLCHIRIQQKDLLQGRALTLLDKTFCHQCKEKAFAEIRTGSGPGPGPQPNVGLEPTTDEPLAPPPGQRQPRPYVGRKRQNPLPLYVGGTVGFLAITALLILLISQAQHTPKPPAPTGNGNTSSFDPTSSDPDPTSDPAANAALKELEDFASSGAGPDEVLQKCDALANKLRGTRHERRWLEIRQRHEEKRQQSTNERELHKRLKQIEAAIAADPDYANFDQISEDIKLAYNFAGEKVPELQPDVKELERKYVDPYEEEAAKWSDGANGDWIRTLAQEGRYKDAIAKIETFPKKLRQSKVWKQLERQKKDYEKVLAQVARGEGTKTWREYARLGYRDTASKNFKTARENFQKSLSMLPADWRTAFTPEDKKTVLGIWYDLSCIEALDAKKAEGDAKEPLIKKSLEWLETAFKEGLFATACNCHGKWTEHIEKDDDFETIRADERFKKLVEKYAPK